MWASRSRMQLKAVSYFITLATLVSHSGAKLVIIPHSAESKVGDTTYFNCSTNLQTREIFWNHDDRYIYTGETILDPYHRRFEIDRNSSIGSYNLVIHSVQPSDAGEYICIDDDGHGIRRSAELVILENDPTCQSNIQPDGVIGQNIFKIPLDEVQLTCTVTYYGNKPQMEWKKIGENGSITDNRTSPVTHNNNQLIYTLKLTGDIALDKSSYVCQTTRSALSQYNCTSEIVKVLYFTDGRTIEQKVFRGDEITCAARSNSFACINQWHYGNHTFNETITTHLSGEYTCKVNCHVRGIDYIFETIKAVAVDAASPPSSNTGTITAAIVVPIVIIILVVLIAVCIVQCYKQKQPRNISEAITSLKSASEFLVHATEEEKQEYIKKIGQEPSRAFLSDGMMEALRQEHSMFPKKYTSRESKTRLDDCRRPCSTAKEGSKPEDEDIDRLSISQPGYCELTKVAERESCDYTSIGSGKDAT